MDRMYKLDALLANGRSRISPESGAITAMIVRVGAAIVETSPLDHPNSCSHMGMPGPRAALIEQANARAMKPMAIAVTAWFKCQLFFLFFTPID